jgi:hypothetical protein
MMAENRLAVHRRHFPAAEHDQPITAAISWVASTASGRTS